MPSWLLWFCQHTTHAWPTTLICSYFFLYSLIIYLLKNIVRPAFKWCARWREYLWTWLADNICVKKICWKDVMNVYFQLLKCLIFFSNTSGINSCFLGVFSWHAVTRSLPRVVTLKSLTYVVAAAKFILGGYDGAQISFSRESVMFKRCGCSPTSHTLPAPMDLWWLTLLMELSWLNLRKLIFTFLKTQSNLCYFGFLMPALPQSYPDVCRRLGASRAGTSPSSVHALVRRLR